MADFELECDIITEYIINDISTIKLREEFDHSMSTIEYVFQKYNINYPDRNKNRKVGRGFHLGKYKNGYRNNQGKIIPITRDDIEDYMDVYINEECETLEEYLEDQYDVYEEDPLPDPEPDPEPVYPAPQPVYPAPQPVRPAPQFVYAEPITIDSDEMDAMIDDLMDEPKPHYKLPYNAYAPARSPIFAIIVFGIIIVLVFIFILMPSRNIFNIGDNVEKNSQTNDVHFSADEISDVELNIDFYGKKTDLLFQNKYVICVDDSDEAVLAIGYKNEFLLSTNKGEHKIWVKSGMDKSKVYTINVTDDEATINFECEIGVFKPKFKLTSIEGAEID